MNTDKWMPEVGQECELSNNNQDFVWCEIRYIGEKICVVDHKTHVDQPYYLKNVKFRPIKSEADKLRDESVKQMASIMNYSETEPLRRTAMAAALYDNGCRMTRELTPDVINQLAHENHISGNGHLFAKAIAAYVRGDSATGE